MQLEMKSVSVAHMPLLSDFTPHDLKDLLSALIAGGFIQKHYVFIRRPCAYSEFPVLSHY